MAAATRVHGCHELEAGRIGDMRIGARDAHPSGLERLAQRLERRARELRQFVEEQHAVMGKRHLARPRPRATADQRLQGRRMMRIAKGASPVEPPIAAVAGKRAHHGRLQRLVGFERRQQTGQARRQHRLARAGRADHQQIVATRRRHFEHALGGFLSLDLREIGIVRIRVGKQRLRRGQGLLAAQVIDQREQGGSRPAPVHPSPRIPRGFPA